MCGIRYRCIILLKKKYRISHSYDINIFLYSKASYFIQEAAQILNLTSPAGLIEIVGFSKTKQTRSLNVIFH